MGDLADLEQGPHRGQIAGEGNGMGNDGRKFEPRGTGAVEFGPQADAPGQAENQAVYVYALGGEGVAIGLEAQGVSKRRVTAAGGACCGKLSGSGDCATARPNGFKKASSSAIWTPAGKPGCATNSQP